RAVGGLLRQSHPIPSSHRQRRFPPWRREGAVEIEKIVIGKLESQSHAVLPYMCGVARFWDDDNVFLLKQPRQGDLSRSRLVSGGDQFELRMVQHALLLPRGGVDRGGGDDRNATLR